MQQTVWFNICHMILDPTSCGILIRCRLSQHQNIYISSTCPPFPLWYFLKVRNTAHSLRYLPSLEVAHHSTLWRQYFAVLRALSLTVRRSSVTNQNSKHFFAGCRQLKRHPQMGPLRAKESYPMTAPHMPSKWFGKSTMAHLSPSDTSFLEMAEEEQISAKSQREIWLRLISRSWMRECLWFLSSPSLLTDGCDN